MVCLCSEYSYIFNVPTLLIAFTEIYKVKWFVFNLSWSVSLNTLSEMNIWKLKTCIYVTCMAYSYVFHKNRMIWTASVVHVNATVFHLPLWHVEFCWLLFSEVNCRLLSRSGYIVPSTTDLIIPISTKLSLQTRAIFSNH